MRYVFGFLMALAVLAFAACDECAEPVDVAGEWEATSTVEFDECEERESGTFPMTITQDGTALTAEIPELTFSGTICGNQIQMSGSFDEDGGTVMVDAALLVSAREDSMEGSNTWTWSDGIESCSGSESLIVTRVDGHCAEPVDVAGNWVMNATPIEDTCYGDLTPYTFGVTIMQEGNALTFGGLLGTICGNEIEMNASFSEYGETVTVNLQLTASADGNSVEGSHAWTWTDGVESCGWSDSLSGTRIDVPPGWTCIPEYYGTADGCDCGCGALDPDCNDGTVDSCDYCAEPGSCSLSDCPGDIDPTQNWLCRTAVCGDDIVQWPEECDGVDLQGLDCTYFGFTGGTLACTANCTFDVSGCTGVPPGWTCPPDFYGTGDGCDCGCGALDPDCDDGTVASCEYCDGPGSCSTVGCVDIDPAQNWLCDGGTAVCGDDTVQSPEVCDGTDLGELTGQTCADLGFTGGTLACNPTCDQFDLTACAGGPPGWTCPAIFYDDAADECDCGCGALDPDCIDRTVASCDYCAEPGSCSSPAFSICPGDIDLAENWRCGGTGGTGGAGGTAGSAG